MTVTRMKSEMSVTEYFDWLIFYKERERRKEAESGNIIAMDPNDMVKGFGL